MGILFVVLGLLLGGAKSSGGNASVSLHGGDAVLYFALVLAYYFLTEAFLGGRTLGKALLGLRVATTDGGQAGPGRVAVRTLLRAVDVLPFLYLVGFISVLATGRRRQRIGDLAARTTVVLA